MLLLLLAFTAFLVYYYLTLKFDYWKVRGIAFIKPIPFFGNFCNAMLLRKSMGDTLQDIYNSKAMKGQRYGGVFLGREPVLMIKDPDVINQVLVKDFEYFSDRGFDDDHPMIDHLLVSKGERWRTLRKTFVQAFTSGRMSTMTDKLLDEADNILDSETGNFSKQFANCSLKSMLLCLFGKDQIPDGLILKIKQFLTPSYKNALYHAYPKLSKMIGLTLMKQDTLSFYKRLLQDGTTNQNKVDNTLFMQFWKDIKAEDYKLSDDTIAAQLFTFLIGSLNTFGVLMSILRELTLTPSVIIKLGEEINKFSQEKICAQDVKGMKYLDQVILETLRMHSNGFLIRNCIKDYLLDGIKIEKGTKIMIPIRAIHFDPQFYPNPNTFDPERFSGEMNVSTPCTYLSFGAGPRKCPGFQLSIMHLKALLVKAWKRILFKELRSAKWNNGQFWDLGLPLIGGGDTGITLYTGLSEHAIVAFTF